MVIENVKVPGWDDYIKDKKANPNKFKEIDIPDAKALASTEYKPGYLYNVNNQIDIDKDGFMMQGARHMTDEEIQADKKKKGKCTCPVKIESKKRKLDIGIGQGGMNGYVINCPQHGIYKKKKETRVLINVD